MTGIIIEEEDLDTETDTHTRVMSCKVKETEVMYLPSNTECQQITRSLREIWNSSSQQPLERSNPADSLILDF